MYEKFRFKKYNGLQRRVDEMKDQSLVAILTDPTVTFMISRKRKTLWVDYEKLPEDYRYEKKPISELFGGNFREIITLKKEFSHKWKVQILLFVDEDIFIPDTFILSPYEIMNIGKMKRSLSDNCISLNEWLNRIDALVISLNMKNLDKFLSCFLEKLIRVGKPCVIVTGVSKINELFGKLPENILLLERKGVARFGKRNRQKIMLYLGGIL